MATSVLWGHALSVGFNLNSPLSFRYIYILSIKHGNLNVLGFPRLMKGFFLRLQPWPRASAHPRWWLGTIFRDIANDRQQFYMLISIGWRLSHLLYRVVVFLLLGRGHCAWSYSKALDQGSPDPLKALKTIQ